MENYEKMPRQFSIFVFLNSFTRENVWLNGRLRTKGINDEENRGNVLIKSSKILHIRNYKVIARKPRSLYMGCESFKDISVF